MSEKYKFLDVNGAVLDSNQLENYLQKLAADHILTSKSEKKTYPIPRVKDNLKFISDIYSMLNEDLKNKLPIHPAGEWILDNFYIVEKNAKIIIKNLNMKKYVRLIGVANGKNKGFSRVYVLANDIIAYTDGKINAETLQKYLQAYQSKKTLSMEELWTISTFLQIALIEKIRVICEKIYLSQMQKRKVENIVTRLVELQSSGKFVENYKLNIKRSSEFKYPFIEYMSYRLKKYGKKAYSYVEIFENQVNKTGTTVFECIRREHFDIATKKISIGNSITSINVLNRLNFMEIFDSINGVEEVLNQDPSGVYISMDYKTKEYYRASIEKIANKTKISELYIAKKCLELAKKNYLESNKNSKKAHVGYYLISDGKDELFSAITGKAKKHLKVEHKEKLYILGTSIVAIAFSCLISWYLNNKTNSFIWAFLYFIIFYIPIKNIIVKVCQYILGIIVKPKLIPKLDFSGGIPEKYATMVVIPTIVKSSEKVKEIMRKLEVYYMANKSENIFFTLLGDCSSEKTCSTDFDNMVIQTGISECERLNQKYKDDKYPKFNFVYRKRSWSECENCYLGWERKRGLLNQFNSFLLDNSQNVFLCNTFLANTDKEIPNIKYIITLDSDTNLVLNTAFELVGAMAHILNKPIINPNTNIVEDGYGIIQPRVGINLEDSRKTLFTRIFSGVPGTDSYTNAISDFYQDNFNEGIFTGKGIYDLNVFSTVLKGEIPENTVLSHDLLEGCYLKCGLASDIVLMDGYPTTYSSYKTRSHRWIRGDFQIIKWALNKKLNILSKYKIIDNIVRSLVEVSLLGALILNLIVQSNIVFLISIVSASIPYMLELLNRALFKKNGEFRQRKFSREITGLKSIIIKWLIELSLIPDKAYVSLDAGIRSLYRLIKSKKHLLEWTTSEEAEKLSRSGVIWYFTSMLANLIFGIIFIFTGIYFADIVNLLIGILWIIAPIIMGYISIPLKKKPVYETLSIEEKEYVLDIAKKTWLFFKENLTEKSNYLPPDNYQEDRKEKLVLRTSPTNIGLALLSVIASYNLGFESKNFAIDLIEKMLGSVEKLPKWNGHLYNWYNIDTLTTLSPRYVSSVDSGNFVGYLYVLKQFLINECDENIRINSMINVVDGLIKNTDFSKLFDEKTGLFSIGYNIEDNKLTDSYYDLLASEARQTSFVAIAKKDVSSKHWKNLSRALTILNKYKGLISWSGTAFEYLMPTINMKRYSGSLLDESCKFMIMSQMEYANKLGTTWGISEAAFNLKDFHGNYQYKAFGIPWLGLKRGLADEMVVSSYGTILAINDTPQDVIKNLRRLEKSGMLNKYGFYESIDYTPGRVRNQCNYEIVKTYMAHHQGLILLSIDNLVKDNIFQKLFFENPEIEALDILLQERMPDNVIITKEKKEKIEKIKYVDYDYYAERTIDKKNDLLNEFNLISNNEYSILIDKNGNGYSKYKDIVINRYKKTDNINQGIHFFIKNIKSKNIWSPTNLSYTKESEKYKVSFYPDKSKFSRFDENIKTSLTVAIAPEDPVEIRKLELKNMGNTDELLEISTFFEPVISRAVQDYAHKSFNNLFLSFDSYEDGIVGLTRKSRSLDIPNMYLAVSLVCDDLNYGGLELEVDKNNLCGRHNFGIPELIKESKPFSNSISQSTNPVIALRKSVELKSMQNANITLIIGISENKQEAMKNVKKYMSNEVIERAINLSKAQSEAKIQYLGIHGKDVNLYQTILSHCLNKTGKKALVVDTGKIYKTSELWKYGISGDNLILTVFIKNIDEIDIVENLVDAFEYYKMQNMCVDLVIVNEEKESYENYVKDAIDNIISNHPFASSNSDGRIFVLNSIENSDRQLIKVRSNVVFYGGNGNIKSQLDEQDYEYAKMLKNIKYQEKKNIYKDNLTEEIITEKINMQDLLFYNEYGGFSEDGKEYIININKNKQLPVAWSNILANKKFGAVLTEGMGGYIWYKNARLNRITALSNEVVQDLPSEAIFIKDCDTDSTFSVAVSPMPDDNEYYVKYGLGYCKYIHTGNNINQELEVYVPEHDSAKVSILHLHNMLPQRRHIKIIFYTKVAMDEDEIKSDGFINIDYDYNSNIILAKNIINDAFRNYVYFSASEKINSYTGNGDEFFGSGNISNPDGIKIDKFSNTNSLNNDNIVVFELDITLETLEHKDISIVLGAEDSVLECKDMAYKYTNIDNCYKEYECVKRFWENTTNQITVNTPDKTMDILINKWLLYQTLSSRFFGRTGFYQSGGAYGFRDQLQDTMCLKYVDSNYEKNQIIKHSSHQFLEGDVLHWWHDETQRGIRTRFSDDFLWLAYVTLDYIKFTGDYAILDEETYYLKGDLLPDGIDENYDRYVPSDIKESIYRHCIRAIKRACNMGKRGLPKIGSGDWNDGFSTVGNKGLGESVWLGFFLYDILNNFIGLCEYKDDKNNAEYFKEVSSKLKKSLNAEAWDGRWYKRAFCDDGNILGTIHNKECRIDGISQSWSVISDAGDNDKKYIAMESLENHLIDRNNGIIKLLDPPFENGDLNPGYIKAYLPGTRENGGQYTHGAIWAIIAEAMLGFGNKATNLYKMINPINHAKSLEQVNKYRVEPYVVAADIYGCGNLAGSGGWTWYTGSSSWYYICAIKYILGLNIEGDELYIEPCISSEWNSYEIKYRYKDSIYNIKVKNTNSSNGAVTELLLNGNKVEDKKIKLTNDGKVNEIEVIL